MVLPHPAEAALFRALQDVRSAVHHLLPDWRAYPEESRFVATHRSYPWLRGHYAHLASCWAVTLSKESSAPLADRDQMSVVPPRRDPEKVARMRSLCPRRRILKASLHGSLSRWEGKGKGNALETPFPPPTGMSAGTSQRAATRSSGATGRRAAVTLGSR